MITHDLSQIVQDDFVYVMKDGNVVEQGFRSDLMKQTPIFGRESGVFAAMAAEQAVQPLLPKLEEWRSGPEEEEILEDDEIVRPNEKIRPHTPSFALRPGSVMYLGILDEYARNGRLSVLDNRRDSERLRMTQRRLSWSAQELDHRRRSRISWVDSRPVSRMSIQTSFGGSPDLSVRRGYLEYPNKRITFPTSEKDVTTLAYSTFQSGKLDESLLHDLKDSTLDIVIPTSDTDVSPGKMRGVFGLIIHFFPSLPQKYLLFIGIIGSVGYGVTTPVWASYLSKLMQIVGSGGTSPSLTKYGVIVLGLCAAQALADFTQEYCLYALAARWASSVRGTAFSSVLAQDKAWFDETANSPATLVQCLIKDADDMRALMGSVMGKLVVFVAMVGLGIGWAMVVNWRLTLIGVALAPIFAMIMVVNEAVIGKAEVANKSRREAVARTFYDVSPTRWTVSS